MSGEAERQSGIFVPGFHGRQIYEQFTFEIFAEFRTRTTGSAPNFATTGARFTQLAGRKRNKERSRIRHILSVDVEDYSTHVGGLAFKGG